METETGLVLVKVEIRRGSIQCLSRNRGRRLLRKSVLDTPKKKVMELTSKSSSIRKVFEFYIKVK